ncbi:MAG: LbFV-ORF20-like protein [Cotesia congregata filamentous virus 2]
MAEGTDASSTGTGRQTQKNTQDPRIDNHKNINTKAFNILSQANEKSSKDLETEMDGLAKEVMYAVGELDEDKIKMTVFNLSLATKNSKCGSLMNSNELKYTNLKCIHDGPACGDINGGRPSLIYGIYCQKHLRQLLNTDIILTEMDTKIMVTPVACTKTTEVIIGHPVLSLIANSPEGASRQALARLPNQIDGIDPIIKFLTKASKVVTSDNLFDSTEISRKLIKSNKEYSTNFANYLECSKDNIVFWDFSLNFLNFNKNLKVVRDIITKCKPLLKISANDNNPIYRYAVPVSYLIKEDRLTLGLFISSIRADTNANIVEAHIPNCQLFNGHIVEGIGPTLPHDSPMLEKNRLLNYNYSQAVNDRLKSISIIRSYSPKIIHGIQYGDYPPPIEGFKKSTVNEIN